MRGRNTKGEYESKYERQTREREIQKNYANIWIEINIGGKHMRPQTAVTFKLNLNN